MLVCPGISQENQFYFLFQEGCLVEGLGQDLGQVWDRARVRFGIWEGWQSCGEGGGWGVSKKKTNVLYG